MAYKYKAKVEGGQGGKKGHSNMAHCDHTEWIKYCTKKTRRIEAKKKIKEGLKEAE